MTAALDIIVSPNLKILSFFPHILNLYHIASILIFSKVTCPFFQVVLLTLNFKFPHCANYAVGNFTDFIWIILHYTVNYVFEKTAKLTLSKSVKNSLMGQKL